MSHRKAGLAVAVAMTGLFALPTVAAAQPAGGANCPPGSWFCADAPAQPPAAPPNQPVAPAQPTQPAQPLAPPPDAPLSPPRSQPTVVYQSGSPPPVVVYQPPPPVVVVRPESPTPAPYVYQPREPVARRREWGLNLHLAGAMIGRGSQGNASMSGLGFGLRYKPVPAFGVEADLDFVGGRDYQGFKRNETAFSFNGLVFLNPRSRAQLYLLGGFGWSGARVNDDDAPCVSMSCSGMSGSRTYAYFGGQLGFGLEWRMARHFALNADLRGFLRGRIDREADYSPEFRDEQGRTTNTSGGGLVTLGMSFYF